MTRLWRTPLAVLVLVLALAAPAAAAQRKPARPELAAIAAQVWQRLTAPLAALGSKGGGTMDPNGRPLPPPPPSTSGLDGDGGAGMDPDGLDNDGGGGMDPNGGPK